MVSDKLQRTNSLLNSEVSYPIIKGVEKPLLTSLTLIWSVKLFLTQRTGFTWTGPRQKNSSDRFLKLLLSALQAVWKRHSRNRRSLSAEHTLSSTFGTTVNSVVRGWRQNVCSRVLELCPRKLGQLSQWPRLSHKSALLFPLNCVWFLFKGTLTSTKTCMSHHINTDASLKKECRCAEKHATWRKTCRLHLNTT